MIKKMFLLLVISVIIPTGVKASESEIGYDKTAVTIEKINPLELENPEVKHYHKYFKKYLKNKTFGQTIHLEIHDYYGRKSLWVSAKGLSSNIPLVKESQKFSLPNGNYVLQPLGYSSAIEYDKKNNIVGYIDIENIKNSSKEFCNVFYEYKNTAQNNAEDGVSATLEKILFLNISRNNNKMVQFLYDKNGKILSYQINKTLYTNSPNVDKTIDLSKYTIEEPDEHSEVKKLMDVLTSNPFTGLPILLILTFPPVREKVGW